ncbi:hypothetical protein CTRI78_v009326 [Colletotrichum trifolii]|uniref:Acyltransferase 3 domain-containing protein n=1 Tax=Colletotrichum trifolii TaxID=5466 RepID=A0A4R8QWS6_COLTR|nr:hypothetical protein CTRI78_v009326 [Colletotrichum trifolii]
MDDTRPSSVSSEAMKLALVLRALVWQVARVGTSMASRSSSPSTARFGNTFPAYSEDGSEGLLDEPREGQSPTMFMAGPYHDLDKNDDAMLVSVRSARNSVSSFISQHLGGEHPRRDGFLRYMQPLAPVLLPDFILGPINSLSSGRQHRAPKRLSPTAYLDGLRGVASLTVYLFHYSYLWFPNLRQGYNSTPNDTWLMQGNMIRVFHSGRASVTIFFVISGYVLSIKTLSMIHKRQNEQVLNALAGSAFRRPFRLFLPIALSTFVIAMLCHNSIYQGDPSGERPPPAISPLSAQIASWWQDLVNIVNPFAHIINRENMRGMMYNGHTWTIPVELQGSFLVFFLLLMFARAKRWIHIVSTAVLGYWIVTLGDWDKGLFIAGLLLAELSLILPNQRKPVTLPQSNTTTTTINPGSFGGFLNLFRHAATLTLFFVSIHLLSYPERLGPQTPGYVWLSTRVPAYYAGNETKIQQHWLSVGSVMFILALMYSPPANLNLGDRIIALLGGNGASRPSWSRNSPDRGSGDGDDEEKRQLDADAVQRDADAAKPAPADHGGEPMLQRMFTTRFAQYLGRISYSLYLWHGTVIHVVGVRWLVPAWQSWNEAQAAISKPGTAPDAATAMTADAWGAYRAAFFWGVLVNTLALLWVSDVFNRLGDGPAVRLTRWIGEKSFRKD